MRITLDVNVVSVDGTLGTPEPTKPDFSDVIAAALQRLGGVVQKPLNDPAAEAVTLVQNIQKLAVDLDDVLRNSDNKQIKNKKGIELHGKIERAKADLDALEATLGDAAHKLPAVTEANALLLTVSRALLKGIFGIDPSETPETLERAAKVRGPKTVAAVRKTQARKAPARKRTSK